MKYDKKGNRARDLLDLPRAKVPADLELVELPTGDLTAWMRREGAVRKAKTLWLAPADYRAWRANTAKRAPSVHWANNSGIMMVRAGDGLKKGSACFE